MDLQGTLGEVSGRRSLQQVITANISLQSMRETMAYATIYKGGPATGGTAIAGVHTGLAIIHASKIRGAEMTSTYGKEKAVLDWTRANRPTERKSMWFGGL